MKTKRMSRDVWEMHIWKWRKTNLTINEYCSNNFLAKSKTIRLSNANGVIVEVYL